MVADSAWADRLLLHEDRAINDNLRIAALRCIRGRLLERSVSRIVGQARHAEMYGWCTEQIRAITEQRRLS